MQNLLIFSKKNAVLTITERKNIMLKENMKAPDFKLSAGDGKEYSLSDFAGKKVILYFYPKDSTAGCTKQALGFAENYEKFKENNTVVIGINKDSTASHKKFADKYSLPFILLSDTEREVLEEYGVWQEKKMCGKVSMGIVRTTFIIDENGNIKKIFEKVKADGHAKEVLSYLGIE